MNFTKRPISEGAESILGSYIPVLDHGFVSLKDYIGNDGRIVESARVSYGKETKHISTDDNLLRYLMRHEHMTPFEMPAGTFHLGMPIFLMRQWVRHRMSNMNEYSGRYSVMPQLFYTPDNTRVCTQSNQNKQGSGGPVSEDVFGDFRRKNQTARGMVVRNYKEWVNEDDIARETARLELPLSTYTYCYWKCDLRNLFNLIRLRSDRHAQWEIQQYANALCGIVKMWCPLAFNAFQDYHQGSVKFTQIELSFLPYAIGKDKDSNFVDKGLAFYGLTKREVSEFWNKLVPKPKLDYVLDLSTMKTGDYFMDKVMNAAVEVPDGV